MDQLLKTFVETGTVLQKAVFLMICGVLFVFAVQLVFYFIAKLWPRGGKEKS